MFHFPSQKSGSTLNLLGVYYPSTHMHLWAPTHAHDITLSDVEYLVNTSSGITNDTVHLRALSGGEKELKIIPINPQSMVPAGFDF